MVQVWRHAARVRADPPQPPGPSFFHSPSLKNTSRGVGDLVLVYKRVTSLAGHTARVSELLEAVSRLGGGGDPAAIARDLYMRNVSSSASLEAFNLGDVPEPVRTTGGDAILFDR